jgi:penicillin-binding protein 1A
LLTGTAHKAELPGWQAAGKTGTSQEWRDAWFVGYTSALVAGVWLGNDDGSPTKKTSGGNLPVEIWSRFMKAALQGATPAGLPSGVWKPENPLDAPPPTPPADIAAAPTQSDASRGGQPMVINRAAEAAAAANGQVPPGSTIPVRSNALLPPAPIPNVGDQAAPRKEKTFLDKLFGGA